MYAYCSNSPVNGIDPCGTCLHRWDFWNDCDACGGKTIGDKWNDYYENGDTIVFTVGGYISGNLGAFDISGSFEFAIDLKGNVQIVESNSFDVTTGGGASASAGLSCSAFVMPNTSYLEGETYTTGGSAFVPNPAGGVSVGASGNVGQTSDGHWGLLGTLGIGTITAIGGEVHGGYISTTALSERFNVIEWIIGFFQ